MFQNQFRIFRIIPKNRFNSIYGLGICFRHRNAPKTKVKRQESIP